MGLKTVLVLSLVTIITCEDIKLGATRENEKLVYNKKIEAGPAIWRQCRYVDFHISSEEVITKIIVTDQRPKKDGEVLILDGGIGHDMVKIELKGPSMFRGLEFDVQIFIVKKNMLFNSNNQAAEETLNRKDAKVNLQQPQSGVRTDEVTARDGPTQSSGQSIGSSTTAADEGVSQTTRVITEQSSVAPVSNDGITLPPRPSIELSPVVPVAADDNSLQSGPSNDQASAAPASVDGITLPPRPNIDPAVEVSRENAEASADPNVRSSRGTETDITTTEDQNQTSTTEQIITVRNVSEADASTEGSGDSSSASTTSVEGITISIIV